MKIFQIEVHLSTILKGYILIEAENRLHAMNKMSVMDNKSILALTHGLESIEDRAIDISWTQPKEVEYVSGELEEVYSQERSEGDD